MRLIGENLACARGNRYLFQNLSLDLKAGESLLITGANGAGKSTLMRAIAGLGRFDQGDLRLEGSDPDQSISEHSHYVGHLNAIKTSLTLYENLVFWSDFLGGGNVEVAIDRLGLNHIAELPARYLSAGQKRKLALARLLMVERPIWLLDEPAVSLDQNTCAQLAQLMEGHLEKNGIVIAVSHQDLGMEFGQSLKIEMAQA